MLNLHEIQKHAQVVLFCYLSSKILKKSNSHKVSEQVQGQAPQK